MKNHECEKNKIPYLRIEQQTGGEWLLIVGEDIEAEIEYCPFCGIKLE